MHLPLVLIAIGGVTWLAGRGVRDAGEGLEDAGNGALKTAGAVAIVAGAWIAYQRYG